jgi:putative oxidoreductase
LNTVGARQDRFINGSDEFIRSITETTQLKEYLLNMNSKFYNEKTAWDILLLLIRIWLGYRMFAAGYASVIDIIFHPKERVFFENWFGKELHFPIPVVMAFIAKGAEVSGGVFVFTGLFTRVAASVIAFTMLVATLVANMGENFVIDGGFTISYFLFAIILLVAGGGKYSLDHLLRKKEKVLFYLNRNN